MHGLIERPAVQPINDGQRPVCRVADGKHERKEQSLRQTKDGPGLLLIGGRRVSARDRPRRPRPAAALCGRLALPAEGDGLPESPVLGLAGLGFHAWCGLWCHAVLGCRHTKGKRAGGVVHGTSGVRLYDGDAVAGLLIESGEFRECLGEIYTHLGPRVNVSAIRRAVMRVSPHCHETVAGVGGPVWAARGASSCHLP